LRRPSGAADWWDFFSSTSYSEFSSRTFQNYLIGTAQLGPAEWRWKLGISAAPAVLFLIMLFGIPRSPRWLVKKQRIAEARDVLRLIGEADYEQELHEITASIDAEHVTDDSLFSWRYRFPIFLAVSIGMFNQLSGINAILYYLNDIFAYAGFNKVSSDIQAVVIGGTNLLFTMLAMSVIDGIGRKTLLLIGSVGTAACLDRCGRGFSHSQSPESAGLAADWLHRLLCVFAGRSHLGVHQRSLSQSSSGQGPGARAWEVSPIGS
jgi:hypothetical protein